MAQRGRPKGDFRKTIEIQLQALILKAREQRWTEAEWRAALERHKREWLRPSSTGKTAVARATYYATLRGIIGPVRRAPVGALAPGQSVQKSMFS